MREAVLMSRPLAMAGKALLLVAALPLAALAALVSAVLDLREERTPDEVATCLRNVLHGGGGEWDWDDFTSVPIADPRLEEIRRRALAVEMPPTEAALSVLHGLLAEAERLTSA